jgi:hypothetical protein
MCGRVMLLDLLISQSLHGQVGNKKTFQDGASECQLKQMKHNIHFSSCFV